MKKSAIASELGLTRATISRWATLDQWEQRLEAIVSQANTAADLATGDRLAAALVNLKEQAVRRVTELESLCGPSNHPSTRIKAIQLWLKLAGMDRAVPTPTDPAGTSRSLELVEDLLTEKD
jgi:hypothetical protein